MSASPETVAEQIVAQIRAVATLPTIAVQINRVVGDPRASARTLQAIVEEDQALAANIVRVANSPIFGYAGGVGSLDRAIFVLGFQAVRNIAMATSLRPLFRRGAPAVARMADELWRHALSTGVAATLVANGSDRDTSSEAFLAGMLHDIGITAAAQFDADKLMMAMALVADAPEASLEIEAEVFGTTHQEVGAALLRRWQFPRHLIQVAGAHHDPETLAPGDRRMPWLIQVADWLATAAGLGFTLDRPASMPPSLAAFEACGLASSRVDSLVRELSIAAADIDAWMRAA